MNEAVGKFGVEQLLKRRRVGVFVTVLASLLATACSSERVVPNPPPDRGVSTDVFDFQGFSVPLYTTWTERSCHYFKARSYLRSLREPTLMGQSPSPVPTPGAQASVTVELGVMQSKVGASCDDDGAEPQVGTTVQKSYGGIGFSETPYGLARGHGYSWYQSDLQVVIDYRCTETEAMCKPAFEEVQTALGKIGQSVGCWELDGQIREKVQEALGSTEIVDARMAIPPFSARYAAVQTKSGDIGVWEYGVDGRLFAVDDAAARMSTSKRVNPKTRGPLTDKASAQARECLVSKAEPRKVNAEQELF